MVHQHLQAMSAVLLAAISRKGCKEATVAKAAVLRGAVIAKAIGCLLAKAAALRRAVIAKAVGCLLAKAVALCHAVISMAVPKAPGGCAAVACWSTTFA